MQNFNQLCEDEAHTFIDVDIPHDEPQNILINILDTPDYAKLIGFLTLEALNGTSIPTDSTQSDDFQDVSEALDDIFRQDKAVRSPEGNMESLPNLTNQKIYQNRNDYFSKWKMGSFLNTLRAFPFNTRIVAGVSLYSHLMPAKSLAPIIPECSRKFHRLSSLTPEEIIPLVDSMWGIADTHYVNQQPRQAEIWYRRIVTAKQRIIHYDSLGTLTACLGVVHSMYSQGRYLDANHIHRDLNLRI
jgi:hypothetical protein